jgi:hypothetical protein
VILSCNKPMFSLSTVAIFYNLALLNIEQGTGKHE